MHRRRPSQEWRQQQTGFDHQAVPMQRGHSEPSPFYNGAQRPRPQHAPPPPVTHQQQHPVRPQVHVDIDRYPTRSTTWDDDKSVSSHTALTLYDNDKFVPSTPHLAQQHSPLAYNAYPPPSPYGNPMMPSVGGGSAGYFPYAMPPPPSPQRSMFHRERELLLARREQKRVQLVDGHLVLDLQVPKSLKQHISYRGDDLREESGKLRRVA